MKRQRLLFLAALFAVACGSEPPAEAPADAVATWKGGGIGLAEIESAFATARMPACLKARRQGGLEQLVVCYRELAESQALESLVLAEIGDVDGAAAQLEDYPQLRRQAYVELFLSSLREEIEISDAEIEAFFNADPGRFRRPGQLNLSNIFRRHDDPQHPQATEAFLRQIKQRFEAGETFSALAREVSHSETRLRGGQVGQVSEDELPSRLARVAFALDDGEVSDPRRVKGGAVLLYVQGIVDGAEPSLEQARGRIQIELMGQRLEQLVSERVAGRELPPGSKWLELDELIAALDGEDREAVVLDIAGDRLSVGQMRQLGGLGPRDDASDLDAEGRDRLAELYYRQREERLLGLELHDSAEPEMRQEVATRLHEMAVSRRVDEAIQEQMARGLDADPETQRGYFEDNRHHYQSPLRFKLRQWDLPFDDDPPEQLRRMEALRERLAAGDLDLAAAASELGGSIEDLGWRDFDSLEQEIPNKARTYLMEVGDQGWSVPYQQDDALHLIRLDEREDPRPLEYEEAAEQVREDYLQRFQQELYRRVAEERLGDVDFVFDEETVRRLLAPGGAGVS